MDKPYFALPRDTMAAQLSTISLLQAMYPSPSELSLDESTLTLLSQLDIWCTEPTAPPPSHIPPTLSLSLTLSISSSSSPSPSYQIQLNITVPLQSTDPDPLEPPPMSLTLRQPSWLSKAQVAALGTDMPAHDILSAIDHIQSLAPSYIPSALPSSSFPLSSLSTSTSATSPTNSVEQQQPLVRAWFYLPSLSTRSKRDDLVTYAPSYSITGFVLAGKPGILCLEGRAADIDRYMSDIKTESWGDIPSYQKKVSERLREGAVGVGRGVGDAGGRANGGGAVGVQRVFRDMVEITDTLGERRGERANRGDMKALEAWLGEKGLGDAFERVVMG